MHATLARNILRTKLLFCGGGENPRKWGWTHQFRQELRLELGLVGGPPNSQKLALGVRREAKMGQIEPHQELVLEAPKWSAGDGLGSRHQPLCEALPRLAPMHSSFLQFRPTLTWGALCSALLRRAFNPNAPCLRLHMALRPGQKMQAGQTSKNPMCLETFGF